MVGIMDNNTTILLTAHEYIGLGIITRICIFVAGFFGKKSKRYDYKRSLVLSNIKDDLLTQMEEYPDYVFSDFRIVREDNLNYIGTVMGVKRSTSMVDSCHTK